MIVGGARLVWVGLAAFHHRGGGGTDSLRVGTQNKTTDPWFCTTTALSHYPCWFTAPCFHGINGQPIVITVVTVACPQWTSFSVALIQLLF